METKMSKRCCVIWALNKNRSASSWINEVRAIYAIIFASVKYRSLLLSISGARLYFSLSGIIA